MSATEASAEITGIVWKLINSDLSMSVTLTSNDTFSI